MPVSASGVRLVLETVPKGVAKPRPPAFGLPPAAVWQPAQLPAAASSRPRSLVAALETAAPPTSAPGARAGRQPSRAAPSAKAPVASAPARARWLRASVASRIRCRRLRAAIGAERKAHRAAHTELYWQAMQRRDALRWPAQTDR